MAIRLYGHALGEASFAQVTRGMKSALESADMLAGFWSVDDQEGDQSVPPGTDAPVSLNIGSPMALSIAHTFGRHKKHWLMLAPNSEQLPGTLAESLTKATPQYPDGLLDGLLAPSEWARTVLRRLFEDRVPVIVSPHGVTPDVHTVDLAARERVTESFARGVFNVLHLTSTNTKRKGTTELIRAFVSLRKNGSLPALAALHIVVDPCAMNDLRRWMLKHGYSGLPSIVLHAGLAWSQVELSKLYGGSHVVCQPSRGEGFGLVPLEARCCGVPVVATDATGHSEHIHRGDPGVVVVKTGPLEPQGDFPGSVSPSLEWSNVAMGLATAYSEWTILHDEAKQHAHQLANEWSWSAKNVSVLTQITGDPY